MAFECSRYVRGVCCGLCNQYIRPSYKLQSVWGGGGVSVRSTNKLKCHCSDMGARLVSYEPSQGVWTFGVRVLGVGCQFRPCTATRRSIMGPGGGGVGHVVGVCGGVCLDERGQALLQ